jgi:hypothetical protein
MTEEDTMEYTVLNIGDTSETIPERRDTTTWMV